MNEVDTKCAENELEVVVTQDNTIWSRFGRWLGLITWNHALIRYPKPLVTPTGLLHIIEAGFGGVVDRLWCPSEYTRYAVYRLKDPCSEDTYQKMLDYASGLVGRRYAFEWLPPILIRMIRTFLKNRSSKPATVKMGLWDGILGQGQVCSSLVDTVFYYGGYDLRDDIDHFLTTPDEIAESELLELIEEGGE